jgi:hypothetical protein
MSVERIVLRRQQRVRRKVVTINGDRYTMTGPTWWDSRYADLVERRVVTDREWGHSTITYTPRATRLKPDPAPTGVAAPMTERPVGMTRQVQRKLYRQACRIAGLTPARVR